MKKILLITLAMLTLGLSKAQNVLNNAADNIVGTYSGTQDGEQFRAKITKLSNGTYQGQIIWMANDKDENGNKRLDTKNPDKKLRDTPCDRIVIFSGLKYDGKDHEWGGTKIYDPQRGVKAKMTASFAADGRLKITGSVLLISESVYWNKIN